MTVAVCCRTPSITSGMLLDSLARLSSARYLALESYKHTGTPGAVIRPYHYLDLRLAKQASWGT